MLLCHTACGRAKHYYVGISQRSPSPIAILSRASQAPGRWKVRLVMDLRRAAPMPPEPKPCAGSGCGAVYKGQQRLDEVTCPCGYGYYDQLQHVFVPGSLVRGRQAPSREEYEAHVQRCQHQEPGAPVLAVINANSRPSGAVVYLGSTGRSSQPQRTANAYSSGEHGSTPADARNRKGGRPMELEPREQKTTSRFQGVSKSMPEQRVEKILEVRQGVGHNCCKFYP